MPKTLEAFMGMFWKWPLHDGIVVFWSLALNHTQAIETMVFVAPGLGLGAPSIVSHWPQDFLMDVPIAKWIWPCPFKDEIPGRYLEKKKKINRVGF